MLPKFKYQKPKTSKKIRELLVQHNYRNENVQTNKYSHGIYTARYSFLTALYDGQRGRLNVLLIFLYFNGFFFIILKSIRKFPFKSK